MTENDPLARIMTAIDPMGGPAGAELAQSRSAIRDSIKAGSFSPARKRHLVRYGRRGMRARRLVPVLLTTGVVAVGLLLSPLLLPAPPSMPGETPGGPETDGATSERYLGELRERLGMVDGVYLATSVIDALPNVPYLREDGSVVTVSDSVVVGTVAAVGDVRGYIIDGERVQEASGSRPPMWQLVRVTVTVEESWGAAAGKSEVQVTFPLSSSNDPHSSIESLRALGRVLLILKDDRIVRNEEYLGLVDDAGLISYPLLFDPAAAAGLTTLADLRAALQVTREPVPVTGL